MEKKHQSNYYCFQFGKQYEKKNKKSNQKITFDTNKILKWR